MKIIFFSFLLALTLPVAAGEREDLLATFEKETLEEHNLWQEAATTVELVGSAGNSRTIAESQYFRALDYKLRHTEDLQERLNILENFYNLSREIETIHSTPRENQGSIFGMLIYSHIALLLQQQTAILMLDEAAETRWQRIMNAPLYIDEQRIQLKQGKAEFIKEDPLYIILFPRETFRFQNRDFAIIRSDKMFSMNDDFSTVYLCELKNDKLLVHTQCKFPFFSKWELKDNELVIYYNDDFQKIPLLQQTK